MNDGKEKETLTGRPQKLWTEALRRVKGEDTAQLMEQFTAEMTLVAEGLCEDQNKLRGEVDRAAQEEDRRLQRLDSRIEELDTLMQERERETDRLVTELRTRLAVLEKQNAKEAKEREAREREAARKAGKGRNRIRDLTILVVVAAVCILAVTLVIKLV